MCISIVNIFFLFNVFIKSKNSLSRFNVIFALLSPNLFFAKTLYFPPSVALTSSISRHATYELFGKASQ
jgi:hypothetical protein